MDRLGYELLAGAARPIDQHRCICGRDVGNQPEDLLHRRAGTDHVSEALDTADHSSFPVPQHRARHADGNRLHLRVQHGDPDVSLGLSRLQALAKGTSLLADAGSKNLVAPATQSLLPGKARDLLGPRVEVGDAKIRVHREHSLGDAVEDQGVELFRRGAHARNPSLARIVTKTSAIRHPETK